MDFKTVLLFLGIIAQVYRVNGGCAQYAYPTATEITADGTIQLIQTPNYPTGVYANDQRCQWHVTAGSTDTRIIIHVRDFSSEGTKTNCPSKDYATLFDGADDTANEIFRVCPGTANERKVYISSTNEIFVQFRSDAFLSYSGISIAVFTNDTSNQPNCSSTLTATSTEQYLLSDNLAQPYVADLQCAHTFEYDASTSVNGIRFYMYFVDIEPSGGCTVASLVISAGDNEILHTAYTLCESADNFAEAAYNAKGSVAELNFTTSSTINTTAEYYGYFLTYSTAFVGLYLSYPSWNQTVNITVDELTQLGNLDKNNGTIIANATGNLIITMLENGATASTFSYDNSTAPIHYITLITPLDFETTSYYELTFYISSDDSPDPADTATVFFNIFVEDADDVSPVFTNLPYHVELLRSIKTGYLLYTVNTTDNDASANFSTAVYDFQSEPNNYFTINATSGEIHLSVDVDRIPITTTNYQVTVRAYSVSSASGLFTTGLINITIPPDSPPVCTESLVFMNLVEAPTSAAGQEVPFVTPWNCTDEYNITYSLGTVSPALNATLFTVDPDTAEMRLVRAFTIDEVPTRIFNVEIVATDSVNQTTNFTAQVNVTNVVCLPNPRPLYARMDDAVGTVVLSDFNCTDNTDMTYTLTQYPSSTFYVTNLPNGTASIVLNAPVFKIKYYSLSVYITNGIDIQTLNFTVTIQFERCGIASSSASSMSTLTLALYAIWCVCALLYKSVDVREYS